MVSEIRVTDIKAASKPWAESKSGKESAQREREEGEKEAQA